MDVGGRRGVSGRDRDLVQVRHYVSGGIKSVNRGALVRITLQAANIGRLRRPGRQQDPNEPRSPLPYKRYRNPAIDPRATRECHGRIVSVRLRDLRQQGRQANPSLSAYPEIFCFAKAE
jgi:hypothetical protein